jgi:hypothetical protein
LFAASAALSALLRGVYLRLSYRCCQHDRHCQGQDAPQFHFSSLLY